MKTYALPELRKWVVEHPHLAVEVLHLYMEVGLSLVLTLM